MRTAYLLSVVLITATLHAADQSGQDTSKLMNKLDDKLLEASGLVQDVIDATGKLCEKSQYVDALVLVEKLMPIDLTMAISQGTFIAEKSQDIKPLAAIFNATTQKNFGQEELMLLGIVRVAEKTHDLKPAYQFLLFNKNKLPSDLYLFFHSGLLFLDGDKKNALNEFSQVSEEYAKATKIGHPLTRNGF